MWLLDYGAWLLMDKINQTVTPQMSQEFPWLTQEEATKMQEVATEKWYDINSFYNEAIKAKKNKEFLQERMKKIRELQNTEANIKDPNIINKNKLFLRSTDFATKLREIWAKHWQDITSLSDDELLQKFVNESPENKKILTDYLNWNDSLIQQVNNPQKEYVFNNPVGRTIEETFNSLWKWVWELESGVFWTFWQLAKKWAETYLWHKIDKNDPLLTFSHWENLADQPLKTVNWWFTAATAPISLLFNAIWQTDTWKAVLEDLWNVMHKWWDWISKVPVIKQYYDSLSPKYQEEFKTLAPNLLLTALWVKAAKWKWTLWEKVAWVQEYTTKLTTWLEKDTQQFIKNNPKEWKAIEQWQVHPKTLLDEIWQALNKRKDELSTLWKQYQTIMEQNKVSIPKKEITKTLNDTLKENNILKLTDLPKNDRLVIKQAKDYIKEYWNELNTKDLITLKTKLRDLVSYGRDVSPNWERIIKNYIKTLDNSVKSKIPKLKELDKKYWPEREFINKIVKDIYNKDWTVKDNALSIVRNLVWKWKEFKLERIEKLVPWITKKIEWLKALQDYEAAQSGKVWSYARWWALAWWWYLAWWPLWALATFILTSPQIAVKVLETYWLTKLKINNILDKIKTKKPLTEWEQAIIKESWLLNKAKKVWWELKKVISKKK